MLRAGFLLVLIGGMVALSVFGIVWAVNQLEVSQGDFRPEIVLPLVVIVGVIALLATLAITTATFGLFEMADKGHALGLPAGSVQAVIALSLILIFAVVALYASSSSGTQEFRSSGLTRAQVKAIPPDQIVAIRSEKPKTKGKGPTFAVVRSVDDADLRDINTQLLTTVSTLVIAVAGFYFGSKSVQEGNRAAIEAAGPTRSLTVVKPSSPHVRYPDDPPLLVNVQTVPPGAPLRWTIWGDEEGELGQLQDGSFRYRHGAKAKTVTLHFEQADDPKVSDSLVVKLGERKQESVQGQNPERKGSLLTRVAKALGSSPGSPS